MLQLVLRHCDNLSRTLQKSSLADLKLQTINSLWSESEFELPWQKTVQQTEVLEITQLFLPRKQKRPAKLLNENEAPLYN